MAGTSAAASTEMVSEKYKLITLNVNGVVQTIRVPLNDDTQENDAPPTLSPKQSTESTGTKRRLTASDILFQKKGKLNVFNNDKNRVTSNSGEAWATPVRNNSVSTQRSCSDVSRPHVGHVRLTSSLTPTRNVHNSASQGVKQTPALILSSQNNVTSEAIVGRVHAHPHIIGQYAQQFPNNRQIINQPAVTQGMVPHSSVSGTVNSDVGTGNQLQTTKVNVVDARGSQPLTLFPSQAVQPPPLQPPSNITPNKNTTTKPITLSQPPNATVWPTRQVLQHNNVLPDVPPINSAIAISPQHMMTMANQFTCVPTPTPNTSLQHPSTLLTSNTNTVLQQPTVTVPQHMMMMTTTSTASNLSTQMFVLPTTQSTDGVVTHAPAVPPNTLNLSGMIAASARLSTGIPVQPAAGMLPTSARLSTGLPVQPAAGTMPTYVGLSTGLTVQPAAGMIPTSVGLSTALTTEPAAAMMPTSVRLSTGLTTQPAAGMIPTSVGLSTGLTAQPAAGTIPTSVGLSTGLTAQPAAGTIQTSVGLSTGLTAQPAAATMPTYSAADIISTSVALSTCVTAHPTVSVVTMISPQVSPDNLPSQQSQNSTLPVVKQPKPVNSVAPIRNVTNATDVTKYSTITTSTVSATTQSTITLAKQSTHHISKTDPVTHAKQMSNLVEAVKNNNRLDETKFDSLSNSTVKKSNQNYNSRYGNILPSFTKPVVDHLDVKNIDKHKERSDEVKNNNEKKTKYPCANNEAVVQVKQSTDTVYVVNSRCVKILPIFTKAAVDHHDVKNIDKHKERSESDKNNYEKKTKDPCANKEAVVQVKQSTDTVYVVNNPAEDEITKIEGKAISWSRQISNNNPFGVKESARKKHKKKKTLKKKIADQTDIKPCSVVLNHISMYGKKCVKMWDLLPQLYPDIFDADDD